MLTPRMVAGLCFALLGGTIHGQETLRVATLNLWHSGEALAERTALTADALNDLAPDLIGLQEVSGSIWRRNRAALLAKAMGYQLYYRPSDGVRTVFAEGLAVLSRHPMQDRGRVRLVHSKAWPFERRFVQWTEVTVPSGQPFILLNTHLTHLEGPEADVKRLEQALEVMEIAAREALDRDIPAVLVGDFNSEPSQLALQALCGPWLGGPPPFGDAWQVAGKGPGFTYSPACEHTSPKTRAARLDYVLVLRGTSRMPRPVRAWRLGDQGPALSDHYGVVVDLALDPAPKSGPRPRTADVLARVTRTRELLSELRRHEMQPTPAALHRELLARIKTPPAANPLPTLALAGVASP